MTTKSLLIYQVRSAISIPQFQYNKQAQISIALNLLPESLHKQLCLDYVEHFRGYIKGVSSPEHIFQRCFQTARQYLMQEVSLESLLCTRELMNAYRQLAYKKESEDKLSFIWIDAAYRFCFWNELSAARQTFPHKKPPKLKSMSFQLSHILARYSVGSAWDMDNRMIKQTVRKAARVVSAYESEWQLNHLLDVVARNKS